MDIARWLAELSRTLVESGNVLVVIQDDDGQRYNYSFGLDAMLNPRTLIINVTPAKEPGS